MRKFQTVLEHIHATIGGREKDVRSSSIILVYKYISQFGIRNKFVYLSEIPKNANTS